MFIQTIDTTYSNEERSQRGIRGLLPPAIETPEIQLDRCISRARQIHTPLEKYSYLLTLKQNQPHLFYRLLIEYGKELLPVVYTPVIGEVCQK